MSQLQCVQLGCIELQIAVSQVRLRVEFPWPQVIIGDCDMPQLQDRSMDEHAAYGSLFEMPLPLCSPQTVQIGYLPQMCKQIPGFHVEVSVL